MSPPAAALAWFSRIVSAFSLSESALASATKKRYVDEEIDCEVIIDRDTGDYETYRVWTVVPDDELALLGSPGQPASFSHWWQNLHIGEGNWSFKVNGSFWYSLAYCIVMTVFGLKAYVRWGVRYNDA